MLIYQILKELHTNSHQTSFSYNLKLPKFLCTSPGDSYCISDYQTLSKQSSRLVTILLATLFFAFFYRSQFYLYIIICQPHHQLEISNMKSRNYFVVAGIPSHYVTQLSSC